MKPTPILTRRLILGLSLGGLTAGVTGCASGSGGEQDALLAAARAEYKLGPADQLRITVFGEADLTGQFLIGPQGSVAYPLVGTIPAAGQTIPEFTQRLQSALEAYVRSPNVSVEVANYRPFFILGEVNRPGTYPYAPDLTVQNAVATAGGFTYRANKGRVYIKHADEPEERLYRLDNATPVLPGDTIRIGERFF